MFSSAVRKRVSLSRGKTQGKKKQGEKKQRGKRGGERERERERERNGEKATEKEGTRPSRNNLVDWCNKKYRGIRGFIVPIETSPPLSSSSPAAAVAVVVVHARRDSRFVLTPSPHKLLVFRSALAVTAYRYERGN